MQVLQRHANFIVVAINSMGLGGLESPSHALAELQIPSRTSMGLRDAYNWDVPWQLINVN